MTDDQVDIEGLLQRAEQVSEIAGDLFGDNIFVEHQAVVHAYNTGRSPAGALLMLVDGLDTVAFNNMRHTRLSIRENASAEADALHDLVCAYVAMTKTFLGHDQQEAFYRTAMQLIEQDMTPATIACWLRGLTALPSSGLEYRLSAIHGKAHALKDRYATSQTPHHELRHILNHVIGHAHALGHDVHGGVIQLADASFDVHRQDTEDGSLYTIVDGNRGATSLISRVAPYTPLKN